jgi:hypothetical protein
MQRSCNFDEKILIVAVGCIVSLSLRMCFLLSLFISFLSISERIFEPVDSLRNAPCSRHLDKTFSSKVNSEFIPQRCSELLLCFSPTTHYDFTLKIVARLAFILSSSVTESFVSVISSNRLHSPSLTFLRQYNQNPLYQRC